MATTGDKMRSTSLKEVWELAKHKSTVQDAYRHLMGSGGVAAIVADEKTLYAKVAKSKDRTAVKRKGGRGQTPELRIRDDILDHRWLTVRMGKKAHRFAILHKELSTKFVRAAQMPGGSIDLLAISERGRIMVVELKDSSSKETVLKAILQAATYRAQISTPKYWRGLEGVLKSKIRNHDETVRMRYIRRALGKRRSKFGVIVAAPRWEGRTWGSFKNEGESMGELLSAGTHGSAPIYVVGLDQELSSGECLAGHLGQSAMKKIRKQCG